jgi:hypothetical protein
MYQLSGQVNLLAELVCTISAGRSTCSPGAGQPARQAGIYQLSGQVNLLAELVSTSSAGRSTFLPG